MKIEYIRCKSTKLGKRPKKIKCEVNGKELSEKQSRKVYKKEFSKY